MNRNASPRGGAPPCARDPPSLSEKSLIATFVVSNGTIRSRHASAVASLPRSCNVIEGVRRANGASYQGQVPQSSASHPTVSARTLCHSDTSVEDCQSSHQYRLAVCAGPIGRIAATCQQELSGLNHQSSRS